MSITSALAARRETLRNKEDGFTLIELLVVVIIIGILAAIAIPIYIGIQNNAKDSAVKSDLSTDKTAVVAYGTNNNGSLPTAYNSATLGQYGWVQSTPNDVSITATTQTGGLFCLLGTSVTGNTFAVSSNTSVTAGSCPTSY